MPFKGFYTASACVLFERAVALEQLEGALSGFEIVNRISEVNPAFGGPTLTVAFRPDINGYVAVDTVDKPWPDHMGDPKTEAMLFGEWVTGHFGPFTFPDGLKRASQHSWGWPEGATIADRHSAFVRIQASYVFGRGVSGDAPIIPNGYDPLAELEFVTRIALAVLRLPGALCYFNPNGEALRNVQRLEDALAFARQEKVPPLDVYTNVRLFNVDNWLVMDTVGNGQLGLADLPDLEACMLKDRNYDLQSVDPFLRNTTVYLLQRGEVFRDGDTIDGPGEARWRAWNRRTALISPPRRTIRFFPEDATEPPDVLFRGPDEESKE